MCEFELLVKHPSSVLLSYKSNHLTVMFKSPNYLCSGVLLLTVTRNKHAISGVKGKLFRNIDIWLVAKQSCF